MLSPFCFFFSCLTNAACDHRFFFILYEGEELGRTLWVYCGCWVERTVHVKATNILASISNVARGGDAARTTPPSFRFRLLRFLPYFLPYSRSIIEVQHLKILKTKNKTMAPKIKRMRSARALQLKAQLNVEDTLPPIIHTTDHTTTTTTTCCLQRQQRTNSSGCLLYTSPSPRD